MPHFFYHDKCCFLIQHLINGHHHAHFHQCFNHFSRFHCHFVRQISHRDCFWHHHLTYDRVGGGIKSVLFFFMGFVFAFWCTPALINRHITTRFQATLLAFCVVPIFVITLTFFSFFTFWLNSLFNSRFM